MGAAFDSFLVPDQRAGLSALMQRDPSGRRAEVDFLLPDGTMLSLRLALRLAMTHLPKGSVGVVCIVATDRTQAKRLSQSRQLAASVFTHAREAIVITNAAATIVDVNDTFGHLTGYRRDEALGQSPRMLKSGRQPPEFFTVMGQSWSAKPFVSAL